MVLHRPEIIETHLVGQLGLGQDLLVALLLDPWIVGLGYLYFVHKSKFHGLSSALSKSAHPLLARDRQLRHKDGARHLGLALVPLGLREGLVDVRQGELVGD